MILDIKDLENEYNFARRRWRCPCSSWQMRVQFQWWWWSKAPVSSSGLDKVRKLRNKKHCCFGIVRTDLTRKILPDTQNKCCITLQQMKKVLEFLQLPKRGPIYDEILNSSSTEFYAIYGSTPAKEMTFNLKCDPVFDCEASALPSSIFSPHGRILML